jgi:DNA-binding transcriptional ArsR family regulator
MFVIAGRDLAVQEVAKVLGTTVQNSSSHLRQLKQAGMATCRRDGKQVYYRLLPQANQLLQSLAHLNVQANR